MSAWPWTIPEDLRQSMEAAGHDGWEPPVRAWAKKHGLKLKLQWFADLERRISGLDEYRDPPSIQTRWGSIKEWLEKYNVATSEKLPTRPESAIGDLGH